MADGDGITGGIMSMLSNPAVETLLPAALGAAGGALTSPVLAGRRGAIGGAFQGGAAGLTAGMGLVQKGKMDQAQLSEIQQHTANMKLDAEKLQSSLDDEKKFEQSKNELAGKMDGADKDVFLGLASKDPASALQYYTQNNTGSRAADAQIIGPAFGLSPEDIKKVQQLPADVRASYRQAALHVMEAGRTGQVVNGADGVYLVTPSRDPKSLGKPNVEKLMDPKTGQPVKPLQPYLTSLREAGAMSRAELGADTREDIAGKNITSREKEGAANRGSREDIASANIDSREGEGAANRESRESIAGARNTLQTDQKAFAAYQKDSDEIRRKQADWNKIWGGLGSPEELAKQGAPPYPGDLPPWEQVADKYRSAVGGAGAPTPAAPASPAGGAAPSAAPSASPTAAEKPTPSATPTPAPAPSARAKPPAEIEIPKVGKGKLAGVDKSGKPLYRGPDGKLYRDTAAE